MNAKISAGLLLVAVVLLVTPECLAQIQFPDNAAGKQAKAWLEVFNEGDAGKHKEFLSRHAPTRLERAERESSCDKCPAALI